MEAVVNKGISVTPLTFDQAKYWPEEYFRYAGIDTNRLTMYVGVPAYQEANAAPVTPFFNQYPARVMVYTMFEATKIPSHWPAALDEYAERVIVPSKFCHEIFKEALEAEKIFMPVHTVEAGIDPEEFKPKKHWLDNRPFTFMVLGDRGNRKGWDVAWAAFYDEFGDNPDVRFVIKSRGYNLQAFRSYMADYRTIVWNADVPRSSDAYKIADCFVFPSRGEGYGLPPREAAACGIPVICSKNTGLDDEITEWALPVECKTKKVPRGGLNTEGNWFEPSKEQLQAHMRWVYENRDEARKNALIASDWIRKNRTWDRSALQLLEVLTDREKDIFEQIK